MTSCIAFLVWVLVGHYVRNDSATGAAVNTLTYAMPFSTYICYPLRRMVGERGGKMTWRIP